MISLFNKNNRKKLLVFTLVINLFFVASISLLVLSQSIVKAVPRFSLPTSVNQIPDLEPTDFYFEDMRRLVERYGCVPIYPDGTFRGNSFITRAEMGVALNSCFDQLVGNALSEPARPVNLATKSEVEELQNRINTLQEKVDRLRP